MKLFTTLALTFISFVGFSQTTTLREVNPVSLPTTGYIITSKNDTLKGKIAAEKVMSYNEDNNMLLEEISFSTYSGNKVNYKAESLKGFSQKRPFVLKNFEGFTSIDLEYAHFESMPHPSKAGKQVFAERLMYGNVEVFAAPASIYKNDDGSIAIEEDERSYFVIKNNGRVILLTEDNYAENFEYLFGDCDEMADFMTRHPQMWEFKSFHLVVELYNDHFKCK